MTEKVEGELTPRPENKRDKDVREDRPRKKLRPSLLSRNRRLRWSLVLALFLVGALVRLYSIDHSASEWYGDSQYYRAWGARCMYYSSLDSIPDWQKNVIQSYTSTIQSLRYGDNSRMMVPLQTAEGVAFVLYWVAGGEHMWLPRALSALVWVLGGIFLYLLARKLMTIEAALISVGVYLFLPAAIIGSRSFQPESLVVAAMICTIYAVFLHHEKPTFRRAMIAAALAASAILISPLSAFMIFGAFIALSLKRQGLRRTCVNPHSWLFGLVASLPTAVLLVCAPFVHSTNQTLSIERTMLQPQLLLSAGYYGRWAYYLLEVIGAPFLGGLGLVPGIIVMAAAVAATFVLLKRGARALVIGLWCGYVVFCLVFSYLISNHHYHHLIIIPLIALCLGPIGVRILRWSTDGVASIIVSRRASRVAVGGILFFFVAFGTMATASVELKHAQSGQERAVEAQTIGELVGHSPQVITLSLGRGFDATYDGWFLGRFWPRWEDVPAVWTADIVSVEKLFHNMCQDWQPTYFVVTDMAQLDGQPALKEFLFSKYPVVAQTDTYLIFDLRSPNNS